MIKEAFLIAALSVPSTHFTRPAVVGWQAVRNEEDKLRDELLKHGDIEDVFISEAPAKDRLKEGGWFEMPWTINGKGVWIRQKPRSDQKRIREAA